MSQQSPVALPLLLPAREVPLGGVRDTTVMRTIPDRQLPMVGAWCFLDEARPTFKAAEVLPHPHTGLQTVTWLLSGQIRHRDSTGADVIINPGQLNLMTAGNGVAHSEFSPLDSLSEPLHLLQFWVALPDASDNPELVSTWGEPSFERHERLPQLQLPGLTATVFMGELAGVVSPAKTYSHLVGAQLDLAANTRQILPLNPLFEYAVYVVTGELDLAGTQVSPQTLAYLGTGLAELKLTSNNNQPVTAVILGGEPFASDIVMWWNFVGRSHADIAQARADWEAGSTRFGHVVGHGDERIPAPKLPDIRLTPRKRRPALRQ